MRGIKEDQLECLLVVLFNGWIAMTSHMIEDSPVLSREKGVHLVHPGAHAASISLVQE